MQQQRSRDTRPEREVRIRLHAMGLRYRVQRRVVPGTRRTVDIAFGPAKVAVDVRGCYWHGHGHDGYVRTKNLDYWGPKIALNQARDADTERRLRDAGWELIVIWECEDPNRAARHIATRVRARRP
jgi:DNA mismatch endonuclease (patch repair protein)